MTPAINAAKKARVPVSLHPYTHDPSTTNFGQEACEKLGISGEQLFKTLVVQADDGALAVAIVPVAYTLDLKAAAKALGVKKVDMAPIPLAEKTTGYLAGGISPLGQKKRLPMLLDASAHHYETVYVSGGRRGLDIGIAPGDLAQLTQAVSADIARRG